MSFYFYYFYCLQWTVFDCKRQTVLKKRKYTRTFYRLSPVFVSLYTDEDLLSEVSIGMSLLGSVTSTL